MASRFRFRARATAMVRDLYAALEAAAIAAARRNGWQLLCIPDSLGGAYGDSAGTTLPALNAPLGTLLDRSFGVETLGPELVTNGDFANGTAGWTAIYGGTATTSSTGVTLTTAAAGYGGISRPITLEVGKTYVASCQYTELGGSGFFMIAEQPLLTNARQFAAAEITQSGEVRIQFVATIASAHVGVSQGYTSAVGLSAGFAKVSVREVIPAANLGPELVANGGFDTASGWTLGAEWSIGGGVLTKGAFGSGKATTTNTPLTAGKTYRADFDCTAAVPVNLQFGAANYTTITPRVGRNTVFGVCSGAGTFGFQSGVGMSFDNLSVREVLGYHATQATAANKPTQVRVPRKLGPELVVNGTFDAAAGWSIGGNASVSGGTGNITFVSAGSDTLGQTVIGVTAGKPYQLTFSTGGSNPAGIKWSGLIGGWQSTTSAVFVATAGYLFFSMLSAGSATIDNVSVREVLEWSYAIQFDTSNDTLASNLPSAGTPSVIAFHNAGETLGYASASASGFTLGYPQLAGREVSVIVASPTAIAEGPDLAAIRRFANYQRGLAL